MKFADNSIRIRFRRELALLLLMHCCGRFQVTDAENQKAESGREHQKKATLFNAAEQKVRLFNNWSVDDGSESFA